MIGYTSQEIYAGGVGLLLGRIHPEDLEPTMRSMDDLFSRRKPFISNPDFSAETVNGSGFITGQTAPMSKTGAFLQTEW